MDPADKRIQVAVRIRPSNDAEKHALNAVSRVEAGAGDGATVAVVSDEVASSANDSATQAFKFDYAFDDSDDQQKVYEDGCLGIIDSALDGNFVTVFAYGQTGSGKTHTILGQPANPDGSLAAQTGLFLRVFEALFDYRDKMAGRMQVVVALAAVEIYVGTVHDLLGDRKEVQLRGVGTDQRLVGLRYYEVHAINEVMVHFAVANASRSTASTKMNAESSRSHALFFIDLFMIPEKAGAPKRRVEDLMQPDGTVVSSNASLRHTRISLVDLAGSERVKRSGVEGAALKEANAINSSLMTLGKVINDLHAGRAHIPFRDSVLTSILKPALVEPSARLLLIGQVSPSELSVAESVQTLKFCDRLKGLQAPSLPGATGAPDLELLQATAMAARTGAELAADIAIARARHHHQVTRPRWHARRSNANLGDVVAQSRQRVRELAEEAERAVEREEAEFLRAAVEGSARAKVATARVERDARVAACDREQQAVEAARDQVKAEAATQREVTEADTLKAKKAKKTRVQREEKVRAAQAELQAAESELEQVNVQALAAGRAAASPSKLMSRVDEEAWTAEEDAWRQREGNHGIVHDFQRLWRPLGQAHGEFITALTNYQNLRAKHRKVRRQAKSAAAAASSGGDGVDIVNKVIPDVVHFALERAVEIADGVIDEHEHYGWFDINGASQRLSNWHFWEPPLNTTPADWAVIPIGAVEAADETVLSDDLEIATPIGSGPATPVSEGAPRDAKQLEITHAQAVRAAREKRKDKTGNITKRLESEEANKHYLMTVYDSPTLVQDVARFLNAGTIMLKHGRSGAPHKRKVWVSTSTGHRAITWEDPDAKQPTRSSVPVTMISRIQLGAYSKVFKRHPSTPQDKEFYFSFTLFTKDNSRTLDLVASQLVDFEAWVLGLSHLVQVDPYWGAQLDFKNDPVAESFSQREVVLCAKENVPIATYASIKKRVVTHQDDVAHQLDIFGHDAVQAYESIGGIHAPQLNPRGAVLMTKGELRYHCSSWNIDIFRVCKIWQLFRDLDIIYDPNYLPATCFGTNART